MDATIRFWDKRVNNTYIQYGSAYNGYSYAMYNAARKVGNPAPGGDAGNNTSVPGQPVPFKNGEEYRYAKVGQGFLIRSLKASDVIKFNNNRRTTNIGTVYFGRNTQEDNKDMYRIQLITPRDLALTQTVAYLNGGNNAFGIEDSKHPSTNSSDAFYSVVNGEKLIINGKDIFNTNDIVKLGTNNYEAGVYKIRAIDQEGIFANGQPIYIKDNILNVIADLTESSYEFTSTSGAFTNRFEIFYKPESPTLGTSFLSKTNIEIFRDGAE